MVISKDTTPIEPPRTLTDGERALLVFLLRGESQERRDLRSQIDHVRVCEEYGPGDPSFVLCLDDARQKLPVVMRRIVAEAESWDSNGVPTYVLVHVDDQGFLSKLEVVRMDGEVTALPSVKCLDVVREARTDQRRSEG